MNFVIINLGICSIVLQFVLLRELHTSFLGNELSLGLILFCWLTGSSLGGFLGRFLIKIKQARIKNILRGLLFFNSLWFFAGLFLSRCLKTFFLISPYEILQPLQILLISAIVIIPVTLSFGISFVLIAKILNNTLKAYCLEALGAFFAGLLTLLLVKYLNSSQIVWIAAALSVISIWLINKKLKVSHFFLAGAPILAILLLATSQLTKFQNYTNYLRFAPQGLAASLDSIYANIAVTKQDSRYNLYENGKLYFSTEDTEAVEEFSHMILLSHPRPKRILLIGSGISGIIAEILKHPVESIDYVELDSKLIKTALQYIPQARSFGLTDKKVTIYSQDGRFFIKSTANKYDLIILNLGDPQTLQLNRFYTAEFFRQTKQALNDEGKFCLAISSKEDILAGQTLRYNGSLYKTLKSVFKNVDVIPGERMILIAQENTDSKLDAGEMNERFIKRNIQAAYFTPLHIRPKLHRQGYILERLNGARAGISLNRDYCPYGFLYYLQVLGRQSYFSFGRIWNLFSRMNLVYPVLFFFLLAFIFRKNIIKVTVVTTGFAGIGLEIIIGLVFQVNFGFLYYRIGAIIASFMLGLCLGGVSVQRLKEPGRRMLFYLEALILFSCVLVCLALNQRQVTYFLLAGLVGFLAGAEFGIFSKLYQASTVYSLDLLGACLGSLSVGLVFIPVLGIRGTCLGIGLIKLIGLGFLRRQGR